MTKPVFALGRKEWHGRVCRLFRQSWVVLAAVALVVVLAEAKPIALAQEEPDPPEVVEEAPLEEAPLEEGEVIQLFPADDLLSDAPSNGLQEPTDPQDPNAEQQVQQETQETTQAETPQETLRQSFLPPVALTEEAIADLPLAALSVLDETTGVLPTSLWRASPPERLNALFSTAEARTDSIAAANLWRRILLSPFPLEATAPSALAVPITALDPGKTAEEAAAELEASQEANQDTKDNQATQAEQARSLKWFVWRTEQLQRLGRWRDLHRLFALVPRSRLRFTEVATEADTEANGQADGQADTEANAQADTQTEPQAATLAELSRLRVATMILLGERIGACEEAIRVLQQNAGAVVSTNAAVRATETWFQRLSVACRIAEGEPDVALLGLDLLRETDFPQADESPQEQQARDDFFALAAARLGYGKLPEAPRFSALNLFLADGLRGADLLALFSENQTLAPRALTGLAHSEHLATPLRMGLAERAVEIGAMDTTDLQAFYRSVSFPPAEEAEPDWIAQAASLTGASQRAFVWQASETLRADLRLAQGLTTEETQDGQEAAQDSLTLEEIVAETAPKSVPDPATLEAAALALADLLRLYGESARSEGLNETAARLWHDTARLLPAEAFLADHAEWIASVLLRAGDAEAASPWLALLSQAQDSQAERALHSLWVEARLAGVSVGQLNGIDFTTWQGSEFASYGGTASERATIARHELHLRFLLDGLGLRAANEDWFALAQTLEAQTLSHFANRPEASNRQATSQADGAGTGATTRALQDLVLAEHSFGESAIVPLRAPARMALLEALDDASFGGRDGEALLLSLRLHGQAVAAGAGLAHRIERRVEASTEADLELEATLAEIQASEALALERAILRGLRRTDFADEARALALEFWHRRQIE